MPLYLVAYLGTRLLVSLDINRELALGPLYSIRLYLLIAPIFVAALLMIGTGEVWAAMLFLVFLVRAVDGLSDFFYGVAQRGRMAYRQGVSMTLKAASGLSAFLIGYAIGGYGGGLVALAGANLAVVLCYDWRGSPDRVHLAPLRPTPQLAVELTSLVKKSLSILIGSALAAVAANLPRYMLAWIGSAEAVAVFVALTSFVLALNVLATALGQALLTRYARAIQAQSRDVWRWMILSSGLVACGVVAAAVLAEFYGDFILEITFGAEVAQHSELFAVSILCAGVCVLAQTVSYANLATRRFWWVAGTNFVCVALGLLAALVLIGRYGVLGGAMTMGFVGMVQLTGFLWSLRVSTRMFGAR